MNASQYQFLGLAIAAFAFSILLGNTMSVPVALLASGIVAIALVTALGTFASLQRNPNATGGQYLELLSVPVAITLIVPIGLLIGWVGG